MMTMTELAVKHESTRSEMPHECFCRGHGVPGTFIEPLQTPCMENLLIAPVGLGAKAVAAQPCSHAETQHKPKEQKSSV